MSAHDDVGMVTGEGSPYVKVVAAAVAGVLLWAGAASAATYYVDFADGDNAADGRSPQTAWKHAPGDRNATDNPASAILTPGDTVRFRGGVAYHGSITLTVSGTPEAPIIYDGNSAGDFGQGRAILDGGRVIDRWQRCRSPDEAQGNPRWREIVFADVDLDISSNVGHGEFVVHRKAPRLRQAPWQRVILIDGDRRLLPIAQFPKPSDPFYPDLPRDFLRSPIRLEVRDGGSILVDETNLTGRPANLFRGMFIGIHGGNNHVYFAVVEGHDAAAGQLRLPGFTPSTYEETRYAFYNSPRLIEQPGEWSIQPLADGRSRIHLRPDRPEAGPPSNIGFPVFDTALTVDGGASHLRIRGFLIQRYSGGAGGISIARSRTRARDIGIADCEIRFISGHAGIGANHADEVVIENCHIHHCPGWTTGIFLSRVNRYRVRGCRLDKNSGSGIRHYECRDGVVEDNAVLNHFGMHASGINVYEGCANLVIERNYVHNTVAINRNAENIVFRDNVVDGLGRSALAVAMWNSGRVGGRALRNLQFIRNTFVNTNPEVGWSAGMLGQRRGSPGPPEGLVVRHNVMDRPAEDLPGVFEHNIYLREVEARFLGEGCRVVTDLDSLFLDPARGDWRRRPGGPAPEAGARLPPPPALGAAAPP